MQCSSNPAQLLRVFHHRKAEPGLLHYSFMGDDYHIFIAGFDDYQFVHQLFYLLLCQFDFPSGTQDKMGTFPRIFQRKFWPKQHPNAGSECLNHFNGLNNFLVTLFNF